MIATDNVSLNPYFGKISFNSSVINNYDSRNTTQYILIWKDGAAIPQLKQDIKSLLKYIDSLNLNNELKSSINEIFVMDDVVIDGEKYSWIEREFTTDYMIYGFEALSRCEKNIRFIESAVVEDLIKKAKSESALLAKVKDTNL